MLIALKRGSSRAQYAIRSAARRSDGFGGYMYVPRATYSLSTSFCAVPAIRSCGTPCFCPTTAYMATSTAAGALIVIDVLTWSRGIPSNIVSMSCRVSIATPTLPTSPCDIGSSESYPNWVGRSNATDRPGCPSLSRNLNRSLDSSGVPKPAYWRIDHRRPRYIVGWTPRGYGYSPGEPMS